MNLVIPYRSEVHNGVELKYALRSIETYLTGWDDVIIMGEPPHWYKGKSVYVKDIPGRKEFNIYSKILAAPVEGDFVFWNDDHFLLKPLDVKDIKYWHNGPLDENKAGSGRNRIAIQNTIGLFKREYAFASSGFLAPDFRLADENNYDIHTPIIYNKEQFIKIFGHMSIEVCIKSYYCFHSVVEGEPMDDCKIDQWVEKDKIKELIKDRLFFSTGTSLSTPTVEYLADLYPKPSRFEI